MHLKNWSLIYPDGKTPALSPAYDLLSTIPYIPDDDLALSLVDSKDMHAISTAHFKKLCSKAGVPEDLVLQVVRNTVEKTFEMWGKMKRFFREEGRMREEVVRRIERHMLGVRIRG